MQQPPMNNTASGAVYVQTNSAPNEVIAFRRAAAPGRPRYFSAGQATGLAGTEARYRRCGAAIRKHPLNPLAVLRS